MIITTLRDANRYQSLHPLFAQLFDYVGSHDLLNTPLGRITVDGDRLYINNVNPQCVAAEEQKLEVHRNYIDVHILLEGHERIGWKPLDECKDLVQPYDAAGDCALYADRPTAYADLLPGHVCIVWPEDAHAPVVGSGKIRKLIAKVKL